MNLKNVVNSVAAITLVAMLAMLLFFGRAAFVTGFLAGFFLAVCGVLVFLMTMQKQPAGVTFAQLVKKQMLWSVFFRIPLMGIIFFTTIYFFKTNIAGVFMGITAGMLIYGVVGFIKLFQARGEMAGN